MGCAARIHEFQARTPSNNAGWGINPSDVGLISAPVTLGNIAGKTYEDAVRAAVEDQYLPTVPVQLVNTVVVGSLSELTVRARGGGVWWVGRSWV